MNVMQLHNGDVFFIKLSHNCQSTMCLYNSWLYNSCNNKHMNPID